MPHGLFKLCLKFLFIEDIDKFGDGVNRIGLNVSID